MANTFPSLRIHYEESGKGDELKLCRGDREIR